MKKPFFQKPELESDLQSDLIQIAIRRRWFASKVEFKSMRAGMDVVCIRDGRTVWIEVKRKGEAARRQQELRAEQMRAHGAEVYLVDNLEDALEILR